ncbi:MAG: HNH endonuclease [candidate division WOR-3 bacterium]|nr:HNH endonuclease [candidate division WOR-3 bacterium]
MKGKSKTIGDLILEYFKKHPKQDLQHGPVVDWVEEQYLKLYGKKPRDTWRQIRKFHQEGILIKVHKGVYKYDPDAIYEVELSDFTPEQKEAIFKRDNYRCIVCGRGRNEGVEICADHIKPKDKGGTNTVDNGQTLCMEHNLMKKNYSQTEAGKKYFIKMYQQAVKIGDKKMIEFCKCVFDCYDSHKINSHIKRPNGKEK